MTWRVVKCIAETRPQRLWIFGNHRSIRPPESNKSVYGNTVTRFSVFPIRRRFYETNN